MKESQIKRNISSLNNSNLISQNSYRNEGYDPNKRSKFSPIKEDSERMNESSLNGSAFEVINYGYDGQGSYKISEKKQASNTKSKGGYQGMENSRKNVKN